MDAILEGVLVAFTPTNLLFCFVGCFLGTAMGVLPGIGSLAAVSLLLPLTYALGPTTGIIMLAGVYYGSEYGGSTSSILLNLAGNPASAVTCLDGHPMARQGRAGIALFTAAIASFIGGSLGIIMLMALTPVLISVAFAIGPSEYVGLMVFGLIAAATIARGSPLKGLAMAVVGLLLGTIGTDLNSGVVRFGHGFIELYDGIDVAVLAMALFGVSEVIASITEVREDTTRGGVSWRSMLPSRAEFRQMLPPILRGTAIGGVLGPLPGTGTTTASFLSYALEKQISSTPERFGAGAIEGVASPEAANNAAAQTAFIPTLAMGIPGSASMAIMLAALMIHNITPGPRLITQHPDLFWAVVASFWIGNIMLLVINIPMIGMWVRLLKIPYDLLYPAIVLLICVGAYSASNSIFDVYMVLVIGVLGYFLRLFAFEPAPLIIGFVLGPIFEENLRRALLLSGGDYFALFQRPLGGTLLVGAFALAGFMIWRRTFSKRARSHV